MGNDISFDVLGGKYPSGKVTAGTSARTPLSHKFLTRHVSGVCSEKAGHPETRGQTCCHVDHPA